MWEEEYEGYFEPSSADLIYGEMKNKLKDLMKDEIKHEIKYIKEENKRLEKENEEMQNKLRNIEFRESQLKIKEENMLASSLRKKFSEMLKPLEENMTIYSADYTYVYGEKCSKCDNNRKIIFKSPSGKELNESCQCSKSYAMYSPAERNIVSLDLYKNRNDNRKIILTPQYESKDYDDAYCKFKPKTIITEINGLTDFSSFSTRETGFATKELCQEYCNYLNRKIPKDVLELNK